MMKNSKPKFSESMQNISRSKSFGKFVLISTLLKPDYSKTHTVHRLLAREHVLSRGTIRCGKLPLVFSLSVCTV